MASRPDWCKDKTCSPAYYMSTKGGGQCIGVLVAPTDHITKAVNTMLRCHYDSLSEILRSFYINLNDIIVGIYLEGEALKVLGLTIPTAIVDNLPKGANERY